MKNKYENIRFASVIVVFLLCMMITMNFLEFVVLV